MIARSAIRTTTAETVCFFRVQPDFAVRGIWSGPVWRGEPVRNKVRGVFHIHWLELGIDVEKGYMLFWGALQMGWKEDCIRQWTRG